MSEHAEDAARDAPAGTTRPETPSPHATTDEVFGHWGENVGRFVASSAARVRQLGAAGERSVARPEKAAGERSAARPEEPAGERTVQRAEVLVDDFGDFTKRMGAVARERVQRLVARAREEAEDIMAEARAIQHHDEQHAGEAGGSRE